jgi:hypothetical protein
MEDFRDDLLNWYWLYVAGRLHKPVLDVIMPPQSSSTDFSAIPTILAENRRAALDAALLQLSDKFRCLLYPYVFVR